MTRQRKTSRDRVMFALAIVPPLALLLFCVTAAAKWQAESAKIRPMLEQVFAPELLNAPSPSAADYAARTSKEKTKAFDELQSAINSLNNKYDLMFELFDVEPTTDSNLAQARDLDPYLNEYLAEAKPILDALYALQPEMSKIWIPNELGNPGTFSQGRNQSDAFTHLLSVEFVVAVRAKETERVIRALRLNNRLFSQSAMAVPDSVLYRCAESLTTGIWNDQELNEIEQVLAERSDLDRVWQNLFRPSQLDQVPWLLSGKSVDSWSSEPIEFVDAPSRRITWFQQMQEYASVSGIGTVAALKNVSNIERQWYRESRSGLDVALQIPTYGELNHSGLNASYLASVFVGVSNDLRWMRTAVAIAKYKLKFDRYPESLADLIKVGLPETDTLDFTGSAFSYSSEGDLCHLSNAAKDFSARPSVGQFVGHEPIIHRMQFRTLFFPSRKAGLEP